jgi:hypothetical protein
MVVWMPIVRQMMIRVEADKQPHWLNFVHVSDVTGSVPTTADPD